MSAPDASTPQKPPAKERATFLIDGFNLYHAIDNVKILHSYKWLCLKSLANAFIMPSREEIVAIWFFTALPTWDQGKRERHSKLLAAYQDSGIKIKHGHFKPTTALCRLCNREYDTYQEKMTDINICVEMLKIGHEDTADRIYLITGDNDQAASIKRFKTLYPKKEIVAVLPPNRHAKELASEAHRTQKIDTHHLARSTLDNPYKCKDGKVIHKPLNWDANPNYTSV